MNAEVLSGLLKSAYDSFTMETFSNRLKLQKFVYLLQAYGLNLGYDFDWYVYGPYATELTINGYQIRDYQKSEKLKFKEPELQNKFASFLDFIEPYKDDTLWLEIAASIHLLKKLYPNESKSNIINRIKRKRTELNTETVERKISEVWLELTQKGVILD